MMRIRKVQRLLPFIAMGVGALLCIITGRTAAHALSICLCAAFVCGNLWVCDRYCPGNASRRVEVWTALTGAAGFMWITAFHLWSYANARYVFIFDDSLYYYQQLELANHLNAGLSDALPFVWRSVGTDYTYLPNLLLAPLFSLTDRTIQAHGLCGVAMTWSLMMYQVRRMLRRLASALKLTDGQSIALHGMAVLVLCTLPILHRATSWCQVQLLGMPLVLSMLTLCWRCGFRRIDLPRLAALLITVMALALMRRWFLFLIAGILLLWGAATAADQLRRRDFPALLNFLLYGVISAAIGLAALWPMFRHALAGNYAATYAYWKGGGLRFELRNLGWLCGTGTLVLTALGYLWGLVQSNRALRLGAAGMGASGLIALALFNRIQSMEVHQVTILMPMLVCGLVLLALGAITLKKRLRRRAACALLSALLLGQYALSLTSECPWEVHPLLPVKSLKPPVRDDFDALHEVADFIDANCDAQHQALFLCNSDDYDRLTFVNLRYPDLSMRQKVALQQISLPHHGFPAAWFSARYYLVPSVPVTNIPGGTAEKLTNLIHGALRDQFRLVRQVDFGAFTLDIMERAGKAQWPEVELLLSAFEAESRQYPKLFRDRIGWYYQQQ